LIFAPTEPFAVFDRMHSTRIVWPVFDSNASRAVPASESNFVMLHFRMLFWSTLVVRLIIVVS